MIRRSSLSALFALTLFGCVQDARLRYPTADSPLELERVVLYRNGIGYFERTGEVDGDILTIKVRKDQVNDLLKSLTVVEQESGKAVSVSMPLDPQSWANAALATLQPGRGNLAEVLDTLRGTQVTLVTTEGNVGGRIVMVEELNDAPSEPMRAGPGTLPSAPTRDHRVTLLDGKEMKVVRLSKVKSVELADGDLALQFNRTLDASAGEGMFQQVSVSIRLVGASTHKLLVSYVVAAPMWKPTYRVVLPKGGKGKALLQAWAVVDNTSGEDWNDITLGLTSGAPIAFRYDLHTPRDVPRTDLTETGVRKQATAMLGETTYDEAPPPPAPITAAAPSTPAAEAAPGYAYGGAAAQDGKAGGKASGRSRRANEVTLKSMDGDFEDDNAPEEQRIDYDSLRRSTQANARSATVSGQTRFDLDQRVTIPEGTSTMVAIVNADVEGEETFLYRPGGAGYGYEANPYRVVRFKNTTPFVLEPGPISIFSGGSFVGEGLSDAVGANTSATVPFAVETGIMVTTSVKDDREEMRLIKMSRGVLEVEQFARRATTYNVKAQTMDTGFSMLVRHSKTGWNYTLANRPAGTEDLPEAYLVKVDVPAGAREGSLTVVEQTPSKSSISIWDKPALGLLEKLLVYTDLTPDIKKKLQPIVDARRELGRFDEQIFGLTERRNKIDQRSNELRENLKSIEKNNQAAAQRTKWTKQLDDFTSEGNKLGVQLADLEARRLDKRIELEDMLQDLEIKAPAAPAAAPAAKGSEADVH